MTTELENDLESLEYLASSFSAHHSQELQDALRELRNVLAVILMDHQPSCRRRLHEPRLGYSCFAGAGEQTLKSLVKELQTSLKPARVLLKPKGLRSKVVNSIRFSSEEVLELRRLSAALRNLVLEERITGYTPYMLHKFRTVSEWRHSRFARMTWPEVGAALTNNDESLNVILSKVTYSLVYDVAMVKKWVVLGSNLSAKDTYIAQCVKNHEICDLRKRVWRDECHLGSLATNDDLETWAYLLAFKTFREEWFTILRPQYWQLTEKATLWLSTH